jgi:NAD(P)-dependent dehydrogenase (short-subunit alcohol dehydrogenase family)
MIESIPPDRLLDFHGKVVLVTGGGRGIGSGIALRFAQAGAAVALGYRTSGAAAQTVAEQIEVLGGRAAAIRADVRHRAEVEAMVSRTVEAFGQLDVLVNNAGAQPLVSLLEMTESQWDEVIETNLRGVCLCTQVAAAQMIRQGGGGAVVNIASIEAENPAPHHSHYDASKAGLVMYAKAAARELGPHGIRVNAVSPGVIWSEGIEAAWPDGVARFRAAAPLGRLGTFEDVADACLFLASPAARWITGANLVVDGGVMTHTVY